jgi:hypothetical protein
MFVSKSKHDKVVNDRNDAQLQVALLAAQITRLRAKWDDLVSKVNAKGGQAFLDHGEIYGFAGASSQFTTDELKAIRRLVHPDKHNGSKSSNDLTTKLNQLLR